ncbi:ABC transporter permease [Microbacterium ulmi]|uniref:ABC transporter permease n=1 Tax=Microbacterium ulmi TaxID=179095 RepID=A0A7Y2LZW2_9MICO|nr:ABC transporter permease [Microbacterium ulmi]NII69842.1 peptide/nickel transport system permease protein [Microbacterium ulmi]NNH03189.1 ABC transporter permease [Microbacterium ulmi]
MILRYALRRLAYSALVLIGVLVVVFVVVDQIGDPARLMLPPNAPESVYLALRESLGLDDPLWERFVRSVGGWLHGDFGDSTWQGVPALQLVLERLPATLLLAAIALAVSLTGALVLGLASARRPGSLVDRLLTVISLAGVSIAEFWLGLMLILFFAVQLRWLPTSGFNGLQYAILPAIALSFRPLGRISQIARSSLVEEMRKPYIKALRAKGLTENRILRRSALKNAGIPIVTLAGDELASFLNGAVVIEVIFAWPGIGSLFIQAIERRDLPLIEACVFAVSVMVIAVNFAVDLIYARLDPRAVVYKS